MAQIGLWLVAAGALASLVGVLLGLARPDRPGALRACQWLTFALGAGGFAVLTALVARADPGVRYAVAHAAPSGSGIGYRIAAVWAGQAGGLLLWCVETALVALFVRPTAQPRAAAILSAISACLLVLVTAANPFGPPAPGAKGGLNPLLLHPMMLIHPPLLFLGYALLAAPYAITVGALIRGTPEDWRRQVLPWVLVSWLALTLGNGFGADWAYKTFGWGGFWAWDPVENTSFVPWMLAAGAVHAIWLSRRSSRWLPVAATFSISAFLAVIYGSYLARSGALAGASVHAYAGGERLMQYALAALLAGATALGLILVASRWRAFAAMPSEETGAARPASWGTGAMMVIAGVVLVGISLPMAGFSPDTTLYNTVLMPLGLAMLAALVVAQGLSALGPTGLAVVAAALVVWLMVATAVAVLYGSQTDRSWVMVAQALFAPALLLAAVVVALRALAQVALGPRPLLGRASAVAHFGLASLLAGTIVSGYGTRTEKAYLPLGEQRMVLGHRLAVESISRSSPRTLTAALQADGNAGTLEVERAEGMGELQRPWIRHVLLSDVYITPEAITATETAMGGRRLPPGVMLEVAVKPGISLVWMGMLCIAVGVLMALVRRMGAET